MKNKAMEKVQKMAIKKARKDKAKKREFFSN